MNLLVSALIVICILSVAAVLGITMLRPTQDNTGIITQLLAVLVPVITALLGFLFQQLHKLVNSRLTELIEQTRMSSKQEGREEMRTERAIVEANKAEGRQEIRAGEAIAAIEAKKESVHNPKE